MCTGDCTWRYIGGVDPWFKISDPCVDDCHCFAPTYKAMLGDTDTTDCNSDEAKAKPKRKPKKKA